MASKKIFVYQGASIRTSDGVHDGWYRTALATKRVQRFLFGKWVTYNAEVPSGLVEIKPLEGEMSLAWSRTGVGGSYRLAAITRFGAQTYLAEAATRYTDGTFGSVNATIFASRPAAIKWCKKEELMEAGNRVALPIDFKKLADESTPIAVPEPTHSRTPGDPPFTGVDLSSDEEFARRFQKKAKS